MVQRVTYTGRLEDDGTEVVCRVVQGARGTQGTLYTGQIEARMGVEAKDIGPAIPIGRDRYHSWSYFFKFSKQKKTLLRSSENIDFQVALLASSSVFSSCSSSALRWSSSSSAGTDSSPGRS